MANKLPITKSYTISLIAICASLYAVIGYLTYLGIFAPAIGVVRFWPAVFLPAVFSIVFGPLVGAAGAAIGIFISDMIIHGNALLSLTVGVPANFIGFYLVGEIYRKSGSERKILAMTVLELSVAFIVAALFYSYGLLPMDLLIASLIALVATLVPALFFKGDDRRIVFAGSTGLMVGSAIIGIGVWAFSQFFLLPTGDRNLPFWAAFAWFIWTYVTEVPFIALLAPPTIRVIRKAVVTRG